ncbi:nucleoid-associated protein [Acinetobacter sp. NIPH1876]|uniref:nucleoid-associated protein n=1 Tax=unclassified Acinetobacter TaxID=196816 RepID=UPI001FABDF19|nr:nucleoid-associated protein [Acinetobacter sp. NIPH1876]MCJ0830539.1 nucleoid-associated protein [Acinetobacter sp. NIPH1876]
MFKFEINQLNKFVVHHVGNKSKGDGLIFSKNQKDISSIDSHLINLISKSFTSEESFKFFFETDLELNPVYGFVKKIFESEGNFDNQTKNISRFLYEKSTHASVKAGELCFSYIESCKYKEKMVKCLVIFKSENKENILNIKNNDEGIFLESISGISLSKLEKGCLILNLESENGFVVYLVNDLVSNNTKYWIDDFLHVCEINNSYSITKSCLATVQETINEIYTDDKVRKIENLSKVVKYFEDHKDFNINVFNKHMDDLDIKNCLSEKYIKSPDLNFDKFEISKSAIKKHKKMIKKIIKLDNNFEIHVKDKLNLMEKGFDGKGKFYKIYYEED